MCLKTLLITFIIILHLTNAKLLWRVGNPEPIVASDQLMEDVIHDVLDYDEDDLIRKPKKSKTKPKLKEMQDRNNYMPFLRDYYKPRIATNETLETETPNDEYYMPFLEYKKKFGSHKMPKKPSIARNKTLETLGMPNEEYYMPFLDYKKKYGGHEMPEKSYNEDHYYKPSTTNETVETLGTPNVEYYIPFSEYKKQFGNQEIQDRSNMGDEYYKPSVATNETLESSGTPNDDYYYMPFFEYKRKFGSQEMPDLNLTRRAWSKDYLLRKKPVKNLKTVKYPKPYHTFTIDKVVARCYCCGLEDKGIPMNPSCHNLFGSDGWDRGKRFAHRGHCYKNSKHWYVEKKATSEDYFLKSYKFTGQVKYYFGFYMGGCFKRFLDVGIVYTQRGCRGWPPQPSLSYANSRFAKLELMLYKKKNGCIFSPHASLTPFQRGISLYVRYHVCVCSTRYCNNAMRLTNHIHFYLIIISIFILT